MENHNATFQNLSINELFQLYWKDVYSFAKMKTKNHHNAEDLTCETFIKAFLKIESYDPKRPFKNWILKICNNTLLDSYRTRKRNKTFYLEHLNLKVKDCTPSIIEQLIINEQNNNTLEKIHQLDEDEKQIITLFYIEDLTYTQICEQMGITYSNARTKVFRAKQNLSTSMAMAS